MEHSNGPNMNKLTITTRHLVRGFPKGTKNLRTKPPLRSRISPASLVWWRRGNPKRKAKSLSNLGNSLFPQRVAATQTLDITENTGCVTVVFSFIHKVLVRLKQKHSRKICTNNSDIHSVRMTGPVANDVSDETLIVGSNCLGRKMVKMGSDWLSISCG